MNKIREGRYTLEIDEKKYLLQFDETDQDDPNKNLFDFIRRNRYFDLQYVGGDRNSFNFFLEVQNQTNSKLQIDAELQEVLERFF